MIRKRNPRTVPRGLILSLVFVAGPALSGCLPLPIVDAGGILRSAVLGPSGRLHAVIDDTDGIKYGVINAMWMNPELVTSEGTLGDDDGFPQGVGRGVLALSPDGSPHVLYYSNSATSYPYLYGDLVHAWKQAGVWEYEVIGYVEHCEWLVSHPAIAVDGSGIVHVAYARMAADCVSEEIEIVYSGKQEGSWADEVIGTLEGQYLLSPDVTVRIAVGPDQKPVIAIGTAVCDGPPCEDQAIRVAQPTEDGGWEIEQIYSLGFYGGYLNNLRDLSLAVASSGEMAVGFEVSMMHMDGNDYDYGILTSHGDEWTLDYVCSERMCSRDYQPACSCQAGDIAFDPAGQLYAMFTRETYLELPPPFYDDTLQSIILARRSGTEWVEETLLGYYVNYGCRPELVVTGTSKAMMLYNWAYPPELVSLTR